jgi:hypothetical protein
LFFAVLHLIIALQAEFCKGLHILDNTRTSQLHNDFLRSDSLLIVGQVAEFVRNQDPGLIATQSKPFPASLLEHCQQIIGPTSMQQRMVSDSGMTKFIADADDLQLSAHESLHTLALMRIGVQFPPNELSKCGDFLNGTVANQDPNGPDDGVYFGGQEPSTHRFSLPLASHAPQSVQSELSARLVAASRLHNEGGDVSGVLPFFCELHLLRVSSGFAWAIPKASTPSTQTSVTNSTGSVDLEQNLHCSHATLFQSLWISPEPSMFASRKDITSARPGVQTGLGDSLS